MTNPIRLALPALCRAVGEEMGYSSFDYSIAIDDEEEPGHLREVPRTHKKLTTWNGVFEMLKWVQSNMAFSKRQDFFNTWQTATSARHPVENYYIAWPDLLMFSIPQDALLAFHKAVKGQEVEIIE